MKPPSIERAHVGKRRRHDAGRRNRVPGYSAGKLSVIVTLPVPAVLAFR